MGNLALSRLPLEKEKWTRPEDATNGIISNYTAYTGFAAANWPCEYTLDLGKSHQLSVIRFLLWDGLGKPGHRINRRKYKFTLSISLDAVTFTKVFSNQNEEGSNGWFSFKFINETHARYVRFAGHFNTANEQIHIVEFEVHDQEPSPLSSQNVHSIEVAMETQNSSREETGEPVKKWENSRILYALSTSSIDSQLTSRGLRNLGLLGYVQGSSGKDVLNLEEYQLTFPAGEAFFYTLQKEKENFNGRNAKFLRSLGFARSGPLASFRQLHRFFNKRDQYHLFTVNPDDTVLIATEWRDESNDNPIFIHSIRSDGSRPLYLYSNTSKTYSKSSLFDADEASDSIGESMSDRFKNSFNAIIRQENVNQSIFMFLSEEDTDVTITIPDTLHSFYVNQQDNGMYTVKRSPFPSGESFILNDIQNWQQVERLFKEWLTSLPTSDLESKTPTPTPEENKKSRTENTNPSNIYDNPDITIGDSFSIEAALGVKTLALEVSKIIRNLRSEPGNMIGVFGAWGRGKTRLM